jgi:preprotein translocase subunit SecD
MRHIGLITAFLALACCDGFLGEVSVNKPTGPSIAVVDPDYVVLRPVTPNSGPDAVSALVHGQTVFFRPSDRILDLTHLDLRTATVEEHHGTVESYVISIHTTPTGNQRLHDWTSTHIEQQLGVFVGGQLISAPVIKSPITEMIILDADYTKPQAEAVVSRLRRGGAR